MKCTAYWIPSFPGAEGETSHPAAPTPGPSPRRFRPSVFSIGKGGAGAFAGAAFLGSGFGRGGYPRFTVLRAWMRLSTSWARCPVSTAGRKLFTGAPWVPMASVAG